MGMSESMFSHIQDIIPLLSIDLDTGIITTPSGTHGTPDNSSGYLRVRVKGRLVQNHQIIAVVLFGSDCIGKVVNHKDGVKTSNFGRNLELATYSQNNVHAVQTGLHCSHKKIPDSEISHILESKETYKVLAEKYGVSTATIGRIKRGIRKCKS